MRGRDAVGTMIADVESCILVVGQLSNILEWLRSSVRSDGITHNTLDTSF
jgi:hypothetical protein